MFTFHDRLSGIDSKAAGMAIERRNSQFAGPCYGQKPNM